MRPITTADDLFAWFEEVGSKVIPPDDVASQAKLARDALKRLLSTPIEGVDVGRMRELRQLAANSGIQDDWFVVSGIPLTWGDLRALLSYASCYQEQHAIVARIWGQLGSPTYEQLAGRSIYDLIDELKALASTLPERVAEAVMGEREACAQRADAEPGPSESDPMPPQVRLLARTPDGIRAIVVAAVTATKKEIADAIRSRPAPAHPMAGVRDEGDAA